MKADWRAPWCLAGLVATILVAAWLTPWHSNVTVDDRAYLEMVQAVSARGLPYRDGVPIDRFVELRARWNVARGGRLWGAYPPLFAYVAVPAYRLGGVRGIIQFDIALLAVIVVGVLGIARRLGASTTIALAAGAAAVLCTPLWALSIIVSSAPLAIALVVWSVRFALDAIGTGSRARAGGAGRAALAGLVAGAAMATHLITVPMVVGLGIAMVTPCLGDWRLGSCFWAGVSPALWTMALFNRARFGSLNPVSYGPCVWRSCAATGLNELQVGTQLGVALPLAVWAACIGVAAWTVHGSRRQLAAVLVAAGAALIAIPVLRHVLIKLAPVGYGLVVDASVFELGNDFIRAGNGPGNFLGHFVIKSVLQSTPFLAVAVLALRQGTQDERRRATLVLAPCAALLAALMLRANLPLEYALGYPFLHMRFMLFAAPLLVAVSLTVLGRPHWERWPVIAAASLALVLAFWLGQHADDAGEARRVLLLHGSLVIAGATLFAAARPGRWTPWIAAVALGYALAVNLAVDLPAFIGVRNQNDAQLELVARHTPESFALVGWPREIDPVLALSAKRDIEYADLYEADDFDGFRHLIDWWSANGRPIFALFPSPIRSPWPDVRFEPLDLEGRFVRVTPVAR